MDTWEIVREVIGNSNKGYGAIHHNYARTCRCIGTEEILWPDEGSCPKHCKHGTDLPYLNESGKTARTALI